MIIVALIVFLAASILKRVLILIVNSIIGFFALFAASLLLPQLAINLWSVLIIAIGGIIGFIAVILLHVIGVAF